MARAATQPVAGAERPGTTAIVLAFAAIYLIWGSTYLAIRFAVETLPPFLMLFARFFTAGVLMYSFLRWRGVPRPSAREWAGAAVVGGLLLLGGTGAVGWAEQWIASVPVWMVVLDWAGPAKRKPTGAVIAGLVLGLVGVAVLVGPVELSGGGRMQFIGSAVVVFGTLSWATGSVYGSRLPHPSSPWMSAALQMTSGGLLLLVFGTAMGEWSRVVPGQMSARSLGALAYLVVFGSLIAFAAYVFLLRHEAPARVGSYAYVNPVVAVFLGWALASEPVTLRTIAAAAIILTGVVLIVRHRAARTPPDEPEAAHPVADEETGLDSPVTPCATC